MHNAHWRAFSLSHDAQWNNTNTSCQIKDVPIPTASNVQQDNTCLSGLQNNFQNSFFVSHALKKRGYSSMRVPSFHSVFCKNNTIVYINQFDPHRLEINSILIFF